MATNITDDEYPMETDTFNVSEDGDGNSATSVDMIEQRARFSSDKQWELPVKFSERNLLEESNSDQLTDDDSDHHAYESNAYKQHVSYPSNPNVKFPKFCPEFEENSWWAASHKMGNFFIRKQTRNNPQERNVHEDDIALHDLVNRFENDRSKDEIWYHATSWSSAIKKVEKGPQMSRGSMDLAYHGAFYLNPNYRDCHDWFYTKDSKFEGKHAMLIYKFRPEELSKKGKRVQEKNKWKHLAGERSQRSGKFEDDWTYTFQSSRPDRTRKSGDNARIRKQQDDQPAMQLIIYTKKMCRKIRRHLIGCVYYENCITAQDDSDVSSLLRDDL